MGLLNITSFLPELSLLILLIIVSFLRLFDIKSKFIYSIVFVSELILISILTIQQFFYSPHLFLFGTVAFDGFGSFLKLIVLLAFTASLFITNEKKHFGDSKTIIYYSVLLFSVFISVASANLLLTYCSFELISFSYFTILKTSTRSKAGELKLSVFYRTWIISSSLMLFGISLFYGLFGSLNYNQITAYISIHTVNSLSLAISILLLFSGFAVKLFIFPMQSIVTNIYSILSFDKISVILITSVISGGGALFRFFYILFPDSFDSSSISIENNLFNSDLFFIIIFSLNMITSALMLYIQKEFIKTLLYLILVNIPFIFISVLCTNIPGLTAALIIILYLVLSVTGLLTAGFYLVTKLRISSNYELKGFFKSSPLFFISFFILISSMAGFPLTFGFTARLFLFSSIISGYFPVLLIFTFLSSFITLIIIYRLLSLSLEKNESKILTVNINNPQKIILFLTCSITLVLGVYPDLLTGILKLITIVSI